MTMGKKLKFYPRPDRSCEVVFVKFVQEWVDKYYSKSKQSTTDAL
ncbi:MAG: hypothetical protein ACTSRU_20710 [Candidatus Hodarchaeales archaeon]